MSGSVYLAGPEVFLADGREIGLRKKEICARYGLEGVFPLDREPAGTEGTPSGAALAVFRLCTEMMRECHAVIANMTPWRGVSMDVGTAVEVGYMHAVGKEVFGYSNRGDDYSARVMAAGLADDDTLVESFGLADNLMCEGALLEAGRLVVRHDVRLEELWTDLSGFEECARQAATVLEESL